MGSKDETSDRDFDPVLMFLRAVIDANRGGLGDRDDVKTENDSIRQRALKLQKQLASEAYSSSEAQSSSPADS